MPPRAPLDQLPKRQFEEAVLSGAREVGRAIESVTGAIDKQIYKRDSTPPKAQGPAQEPSAEQEPAGTESGAPHPPDEPKGPRVG